mmetsp:Transcript_16238/g.48786  ORF Transcript_16238/g.48786 Transcript_16238/m.48786 type:complete len:103 (+) Transcript_16238:2-310(+)
MPNTHQTHRNRRKRMGLLGFAFDAVLVSTACAGLRRSTGINAARMLQDKMSNPALRTATGAYFRVGEVVLDKTIQFAQNLNENKDRDDRRIDSSKKDDDRKN